MTKTVALAQLVHSIDVRRILNDDHVLLLAGLIEGGIKLPPPQVTKTLRVVDGRHRIAAFDLLGTKDIIVQVVADQDESDLYFAAMRANVGGALPPTVTDITHTIKRLLTLGVSQKDVIAGLPFPASLSRKYIGYVRSNENKDKTYRALEAIREGRITLADAAKKFDIPAADLQAVINRKRVKANTGSIRSVITRRIKGMGTSNGKIVKKLMEQIDDGDLTLSQGNDIMDHIGAGLNTLLKSHDNRMDRFRVNYGLNK